VVLVDSSVWIIVGVRAVSLNALAEDAEIATCPAIVQEVLQGSSGPADYRRWRQTLFSARILDAPVPFERYEEAARLYLRCRDAGFTIRKAADCLIAACAIAHDVPVLHNDRDFQYISQVTSLKTRRL
jgi:predicted nucleic acid-binding protein